MLCVVESMCSSYTVVLVGLLVGGRVGCQAADVAAASGPVHVISIDQFFFYVYWNYSVQHRFLFKRSLDGRYYCLELILGNMFFPR
jgi:hypothetical protein